MQWSPNPLRTAGLALAALVLGVAAAVIADWPGRLLVGGAAVGLVVAVGYDLVARPRLAAGPDGVVVHTWSGRQRLPWEGLRARVRTIRRLGVPVSTLEIDMDPDVAPDVDGDGVLVVLGRRDVGAPVEEVARRLRAMNPAAPRGGSRHTPLD